MRCCMGASSGRAMQGPPITPEICTGPGTLQPPPTRPSACAAAHNSSGRAFGLQPAQPRLEALRQALERHDLNAFEAAALRLLGIGHGLTPSGDDLVGAVMFTLVYAPIKAWQPAMADLQNRLRLAATTATNPISAALLEDLMAGASYRALHDLLAALHSLDQQLIQAAVQTLLRLGATSGGDMLAGVLLTLQNLEPAPDSP